MSSLGQGPCTCLNAMHLYGTVEVTNGETLELAMISNWLPTATTGEALLFPEMH